MQTVSTVIGLSWCVAGLLMSLLAIPLVRRRVPPNSVYGARFGAAFSSPKAWYAINRYAGKRMVAWGIPLILLGLALLVVAPRLSTAGALLFGFTPIAFVLIPTILTYRFGRRFVGDAGAPTDAR